MVQKLQNLKRNNKKKTIYDVKSRTVKNIKIVELKTIVAYSLLKTPV